MTERVSLNETGFRQLISGEEVVIGEVHILLDDIGMDRILRVVADAHIEWEKSKNIPKEDPEGYRG